MPNVVAPTSGGEGVPTHVAIIMDGNGRWAAARGLPRVEGHRRGVQAVRASVRAAGELGIKVLTLYSFSVENWSRPRNEIFDLMNLLRHFVRDDLADLHRAGVRVRVIGERANLDLDLQALIQECETLTRDNTALTLVVAFNYGSRQELAATMRHLAGEVADGRLRPDEINVDLIGHHLYASDLPDPDLVIRTSGEQRLSNFLLWQAAYAEFVFLPLHWPDFNRAALEAALAEFRGRERRFGGLLKAGS
ncbi:isoprenyl transferase [Terrihabitans sp. B22-R8]|uniref:isoprenyl transferase n=1 Tax=Terrihabitans sp. B22-R8 TaxID=3425128 RepID=UPI00403D252C